MTDGDPDNSSAGNESRCTVDEPLEELAEPQTDLRTAQEREAAVERVASSDGDCACGCSDAAPADTGEREELDALAEPQVDLRTAQEREAASGDDDAASEDTGDAGRGDHDA